MKVIFIKKRRLLTVLELVFLLTLCFVGGLGRSASAVYLASTNRELPIYNVQTDESKCAISFDAAWGADKTLAIINTCKKYNVKATFFLVGFWVEENLETAKQIVDNGFEVGLHSNTHRDLAKLSADEIRADISKNIEIIKTNLGVEPKLIRVPYGSYNDRVITTLRDMNLQVVQWDVDSLDWKGLSSAQIAGRINSRAKAGSIILCHNNADNIVPALTLVFENLKNKNLTVVPVGELIYTDNYTINNQGTQIKK